MCQVWAGGMWRGHEWLQTTPDNDKWSLHIVWILSPLSFFFSFHYFCLNFVVFLREIGAPEGRVERTN